MSVIYHSPTEPAALVRSLTRAAAAEGIDVECSSFPERKGVDFLWRGNGGWHGAQRKELQDFLASLDDGRLAKEIGQMNASVVIPSLILEGRPRETTDGELLLSGYGPKITARGLRKRLLSIAARGVHVIHVSRVDETVSWIVDTFLWAQEASHGTALARPKPRNDWGKPSNRDYQLHLLQGIPGVGPGMAGAIVDTLGRCPLRIDATLQELVTVPGVGTVTARRMLASINGTGAYS